MRTLLTFREKHNGNPEMRNCFVGADPVCRLCRLLNLQQTSDGESRILHTLGSALQLLGPCGYLDRDRVFLGIIAKIGKISNLIADSITLRDLPAMGGLIDPIAGGHLRIRSLSAGSWNPIRPTGGRGSMRWISTGRG